jgi:membrane protein involved in colicin uptake
MKKLLALALVAGMVAFVACGPSKKDQEAKEKAKQDSIKAAEKAKKEADSLAAVEKEKRRMDSLKQDSIAKAKNKPHGGSSTHGGGSNQPKQPTQNQLPKGTRPGATKTS